MCVNNAFGWNKDLHSQLSQSSQRKEAKSGQEVLQAARLPSWHSATQYFTSLADSLRLLVKQGQHATVSENVELLFQRVPPDLTFRAAGLLALCVGVSSSDQALREPQRKAISEAYARRAMGLLARLGETGFFKDANRIKEPGEASDFSPLRSHKPFMVFVKELVPKRVDSRP